MNTKIILASSAAVAILFGLYIWHDKMDFENMTINVGTFHDVTADITEKLVVFPGDPKFNKKAVSTLGAESHYGLDQITLCNHAGTHIDFPAHVIPGGKTSSDYQLDDLILDGMVIQVPNDAKSISAEFVRGLSLKEKSCVFFKTSNSAISKHGELVKNFVFIEPEAAQALLEKKVSIVGIDYISVDGYHAEDLPVHKLLLSNGVLIVENLELGSVESGEYKVFIMPTKIPNMDGLPARVMLAR